MPRRNLFVLVAVTLVAVLCYQRVQRNQYGRVLANAMAMIENRYVEPVQSLRLFEGAMDGMIGTLDANSIYIPPVDVREFHETIDQQFGGVGMEVTLEPETKRLMVLCPLAGSPAYAAGIRAGDRILRIGKNNTLAMSLKDAVGLLRGKPGEPVTLTILHEGEKKPVEVKIVRAEVQAPTVLGDRRNDDGSWDYLLEGRDRIGYVRVTNFTDTTAHDLEKALEWLSTHDTRGLVLDLRDDPGGYLSAAVDVCNLLIRSGVIVTVRRRDGRIGRTYSADGKGRFTDFPVAVLVNELSASAAEIVAACLQDHGRAVVVGQRTYGKGTIQELIDLEKGCGAVKLTTASYWCPSGRNLQRPLEPDVNANWGVSPDEGYEVTPAAEEQTRWRVWRARRDANHFAAEDGAEPFVDRPLERAVEYVKKEAVAMSSR